MLSPPQGDPSRTLSGSAKAAEKASCGETVVQNAKKKESNFLSINCKVFSCFKRKPYGSREKIKVQKTTKHRKSRVQEVSRDRSQIIRRFLIAVHRNTLNQCLGGISAPEKIFSPPPPPPNSPEIPSRPLGPPSSSLLAEPPSWNFQ